MLNKFLKDFFLRPAKISDAEKIVALIKDIAEENIYFLIEPQSLPQTRDEMEKYMKRLLDKKSGFFFGIAVQDEDVVGFIELRRPPSLKQKHVAEIGIGVHRNKRGKGIGKSLLYYGIAEAKNMGFKKVKLAVFESNKKAIELYRKVGFSFSGCEKKEIFVNNSYEDLIHMELFINMI